MPSFLHLYCYYLSSCHLKPLMKQAEREARKGGKEHYSSHMKVCSPLSSFQTIFYIANKGKNLFKIESGHVLPQMKPPQWLPITFIITSDLLKFISHLVFSFISPHTSSCTLCLAFAHTSPWVNRIGPQLLFLANYSFVTESTLAPLLYEAFPAMSAVKCAGGLGLVPVAPKFTSIVTFIILV